MRIAVEVGGEISCEGVEKRSRVQCSTSMVEVNVAWKACKSRVKQVEIEQIPSRNGYSTCLILSRSGK